MFCVGKLANIILYDEIMENVVKLFMVKNVDYHFNILPDIFPIEKYKFVGNFIGYAFHRKLKWNQWFLPIYSNKSLNFTNLSAKNIVRIWNNICRGF